jgi:hypothetical protein
MEKFLQMKQDAYDYRPISAQSLIRKVLLLIRYFPMYTDNTQIMVVAERAILAAKMLDVSELYLKIQHLLPGDLVSYNSIDTVCDATQAVNYPTEFLKSLDLPDMSLHNLQLKVGSPIILFHNSNPPLLSTARD